MVRFCPICEKLLKKKKVGEDWKLVCDTCNFQTEPEYTKTTHRKISDAAREKNMVETKTLVIDEAARRKLVPASPNLICFRCKSHQIEFIQLQTRRADEPMTTFYRCANCGNRWRAAG